MHIPDGYLSPSTCATLYAASLPFWYVGLQKVKRLLSTRLVPLLSVFSAFSFVIMMFNLPLPGGTTGHATGAAIAAIVLGPWAAVLAISVALLIQALFFGDGGITAFGANCFNMAITASLTANIIYRLVSGSAAINSGRRVFAAGLAGYLAINLSALLTAVEFGIQPMLFKDATGAPLYAPYGLSVAIPAMMIGHLTFAGFAEAILTAGVVAYLQRTDISLLKMTAPDAIFDDNVTINQSGWRATRPLWWGLALLMLLTPLGLLAAGTAWGEWSAEDFRKPETRQQIEQASGQQYALEKPPTGLERLSKVWTAPIPDYAPSFLKSEKLGYILSAMFGTGLIILVSLGIKALTRKNGNRMPEKTIRRPKSFIEKTITGLAEVAEQALYAESLAKENGLLQSLDARVKVIGLIALIIAAALSKKVAIILSLLVLAILLALLSKIPFRSLLRRVWLSAFLFTGVIALPAIFITPGEVIYRLPVLHWSVTEQGLRSAIYLLSRVETAATFAALLVLTTPWMHVLKALRTLGVPVVFVVIFGMTHRYIFLMLQTARDMFESRQSRIIGKLTGADSRRLAAASVGVMLSKSFYFSNEIYQAMQSRGFRGEVYLLDEFQMQSRDWMALVIFLIIAIVAFLFS